MRNFLVLFLVTSRLLPHLGLLDQFVNDPLATVFCAAGQQSASLCRFICEEEKARLLSPSMNSEYFLPLFVSAVVNFCKIYLVILTELNEVLDRLKQGSSQSPQRILETSDMSGDETVSSKKFRKFLSQKTFRMKEVYGADEIGRFFVTRPTDTANKPSHLFFRVCRKDVSILTRGHHKVLRHFQGAPHFA